MLTVIGDLIDDVLVTGLAALERATDNPVTIRHSRGGSAANVAAASASLGAVRFIGRIGEDTVGESLVHRLEAAGVEVRVQREGRTGTIVILVDGEGERTMITDRAAAAELGPIAPEWLVGTTWLHLPLYGFSTSGSAAALVEAAEGCGAPVSLDLSSVATMRDLGAGALAGILAAVRPAVVFANRDEAEVAAELGIRPERDGVYVVKRGAEPVHVFEGGALREVAVEPVADVIDSTGAGDAFAAGYLAAAQRGLAPHACAVEGAALAAQALTSVGAI